MRKIPDRDRLVRWILTCLLPYSGYTGPFSGGRHSFMKKGEKKIRIPNPHSRGDIHISLVKEILRQDGISRDEWEKV